MPSLPAVEFGRVPSYGRIGATGCLPSDGRRPCRAGLELERMAPAEFTLLIADTEDGSKAIQKVLQPGFRFVTATGFDDCVARLRDDFDMILCGVHFAESRMFDLLRMAKAEPQSREKPMLCYRDLPSQLSMTNFEALEISCKALGAVGFMDFYALRMKVGPDNADRVLRRMVLSYLGELD